MLDALYRIRLDSGFLVARKIDVGEDQQSLPAIDDVRSAVEAHRLDATFLAAGFVQSIGEGYGLSSAPSCPHPQLGRSATETRIRDGISITHLQTELQVARWMGAASKPERWTADVVLAK